jgi:hypothetical protein
MKSNLVKSGNNFLTQRNYEEALLCYRDFIYQHPEASGSLIFNIWKALRGQGKEVNDFSVIKEYDSSELSTWVSSIFESMPFPRGSPGSARQCRC